MSRSASPAPAAPRCHVCGRPEHIESCETQGTSPAPERMSDTQLDWLEEQVKGLDPLHHYPETVLIEARRARESESDAQQECLTLRGIVEKYDKDLAAKDAEIEKWKAWEAQEREDKMHQQARAEKAEAERDEAFKTARTYAVGVEKLILQRDDAEDRATVAEARAERLKTLVLEAQDLDLHYYCDEKPCGWCQRVAAALAEEEK